MPSDNQNGLRTKFEIFAETLPSLLFTVTPLVIFAIIAWGLSDKQGFLSNLATMETARGLITFLITITTVGIAVILTISTILGKEEGADKRFDRGKQVLTSLIGIVGTIVGFYYGSTTDARGGQARSVAQQPQQQAPTIAPANLKNQQLRKGEKFTILSFVSGGTGPYKYSITFDVPFLSAITDKTTDGHIREEILVPDTVDADKDVRFEISVKDSTGKAADYNKDGAQKISIKTK